MRWPGDAGMAILGLTWKDPSGQAPDLAVRVNGAVVMAGGAVTGSSGAVVQSVTLQSVNSIELTIRGSAGTEVVLKVAQ
jgi:hypothetical protein